MIRGTVPTQSDPNVTVTCRGLMWSVAIILHQIRYHLHLIDAEPKIIRGEVMILNTFAARARIPSG